MATLARIIAAAEAVYDRHGFVRLETPVVEYADILGGYLPDTDRPHGGVFAFEGESDQPSLALRYDFTAPLARYVAATQANLPMPFRRWQSGVVFRNEKPKPGRLRQFVQIDADTIGAETVVADAELCLMAADILTTLGLGDIFRIRVNNRLLLDAVLDSIAIDADDTIGRLKVLRALDKLDRLGIEGVQALLGPGRRDPSGDFMPGIGLKATAIDRLLQFLSVSADKSRGKVLDALDALVGDHPSGRRGLDDLGVMDRVFTAHGGAFADRIVFDCSVVRGLGYYTGPVFEAELTGGGMGVLGAVGGGGRYDDLIARFGLKSIPATGFSLGASRLLAVLQQRAAASSIAEARSGPILITVMQPDDIDRALLMAADLHRAGLSAEPYLGSGRLGAQLKYADRRGAVVAIIEGEDERARGEVVIKDLQRGTEMAQTIKDNRQWRAQRPAQRSLARTELIPTLRAMLAGS